MQYAAQYLTKGETSRTETGVIETGPNFLSTDGVPFKMCENLVVDDDNREAFTEYSIGDFIGWKVRTGGFGWDKMGF